MTKIAVPSEAPGGLAAAVSDHFGSSDAFTVIEVEDDEVLRVEVLPNAGHGGGCIGIAKLLADQGVEVLIVAGMGLPPLRHMEHAGLVVFYSEGQPTVSLALAMFVAGQARRFSLSKSCPRRQGGRGGHGGGGHGGGGHGHRPGGGGRQGGSQGN